MRNLSLFSAAAMALAGMAKPVSMGVSEPVMRPIRRKRDQDHEFYKMKAAAKRARKAIKFDSEQSARNKGATK